ncbi:MAG: rhomboid family intramembrane serine protease [Chitinophagaceae bacterium]|nr:rhomboid family intramembrane serine protease [Chitinophagaceae bacterium]
MGYTEREYQQRLSLAQERNNLIMLIAVNVVLFVILIFIRAVYALQNPDSAIASAKFDANVVSWFSLPADLGQWLQKPWTIITYMFVHVDVWHILGNMLWLWVFGFILHDLTGNRKIIPIYLYGGLLGGIAYMAAYNLLPGLISNVTSAQMIGASGGVMAVAVAVTTLAPGYRLFPLLNGGIPVWVITGIYLIIDLAFFTHPKFGWPPRAPVWRAGRFPVCNCPPTWI